MRAQKRNLRLSLANEESSWIADRHLERRFEKNAAQRVVAGNIAFDWSKKYQYGILLE